MAPLCTVLSAQHCVQAVGAPSSFCQWLSLGQGGGKDALQYPAGSGVPQGECCG